MKERRDQTQITSITANLHKVELCLTSSLVAPRVQRPSSPAVIENEWLLAVFAARDSFRVSAQLDVDDLRNWVSCVWPRAYAVVVWFPPMVCEIVITVDGIDYIAHSVTGYFIPSINKLLPQGVAGLEMDLNLAFLENSSEISHTPAISATYNTLLRLMPRLINSFTPGHLFF